MSSSSHVSFQSIFYSPATSSLMTFDPRAHQFSVTSFRPRLWDRSLSRCWFASTGEFYQQQGIFRVPAEHGTSDIEPFWDDTFRIRYGRWRIDMCAMAMLVSEERQNDKLIQRFQSKDRRNTRKLQCLGACEKLSWCFGLRDESKFAECFIENNFVYRDIWKLLLS